MEWVWNGSISSKTVLPPLITSISRKPGSTSEGMWLSCCSALNLFTYIILYELIYIYIYNITELEFNSN